MGPGESGNGCYLSEVEGLQAEWATQQAVHYRVRWASRREIVKTLLRDESGQTLIFVAMSMSVILGFVAMATDVGTLLHDKRSLQIAADSAAIAGAFEALVAVLQPRREHHHRDPRRPREGFERRVLVQLHQAKDKVRRNPTPRAEAQPRLRTASTPAAIFRTVATR